jgi:ABC-type antimicrobial peptide transport system permease subunit
LWVLPKINQTTLFGSILIPHHHHHQIFASIFCPVSWGRSFTIANFFLQFILFFWVLEAS